MRKGLLAKKSVDSLICQAQSEAHHGGFKKALGPFQLTAIGIGAIIGAGIFVLTGQAAAMYAGPAIVFSFVIAAIIALFAALCYAEMASIIPVSGSVYTYTYVCLGELPAWIFGWILLMKYVIICAVVPVGWSSYFVNFLQDLGISMPSSLSSAPFGYDLTKGWHATGSYINLPAMCIVAILGTLVALGTRVAVSVNSLMVVIKLVVIALFIIFGIYFINPDNWTPFIPKNSGVFGQFGWSGILRAAGVAFFAYNGFDVVSTLTQESKQPQKNLPIGLLGSLSISTTLYLIMSLVMTGIVSYLLLNVPDPVAVAINAFGPSWVWIRYLIKSGILIGLASLILVQLLGTTRVLYTMAHDRLIPSHFGKIHPKFRSPLFSIVVVTLISMILGALFPVSALSLLVSIGALQGFGGVCIGVIVLRYTNRSLHRPFTCPLFPWIPLAGALLCTIQMFFLPLTTWIQFLIWTLVGIAVYFLYSKKHSPLQKK